MNKITLVLLTVMVVAGCLFLSCQSDIESATIGQSGISLGAVDMNGDGTADGTAIDIDGDGEPDGIDTNGDGIVDEEWSTNYNVIINLTDVITLSANGTTIENSDTYDLGNIQTFKKKVIKVSIKNIGNEVLNLSKITICGTDSESFSFESEPVTYLKADESTTLNIAYDFLVPGSKSVTLTVGSDNISGTCSFSLTASASERKWMQVVEKASWSKRRFLSSVVYNNKMWVMGGMDTNNSFLNDVWWSTDGLTWTQATSSAGWKGREDFTTLVYDGKMWIMGGYGSSDSYFNDVWWSTDGITWTQATDSADWECREGYSAVVFENKMWILGGYRENNKNNIFYNDVWFSTDGINWSMASESSEWSARFYSASAVLDNKIWIVGGYGDDYYNDVWYSTDGGSWTQATSDQDKWPLRDYFSSVVYDDKIWVIGGGWITNDYYNDFWYTSDGVSWTQWSKDSGYGGRGTHSSLVYNDNVWIMGGIGNNNTYYNDVWSW